VKDLGLNVVDEMRESQNARQVPAVETRHPRPRNKLTCSTAFDCVGVGVLFAGLLSSGQDKPPVKLLSSEVCRKSGLTLQTHEDGVILIETGNQSQAFSSITFEMLPKTTICAIII
jgi:hypothetical protein